MTSKSGLAASGTSPLGFWRRHSLLCVNKSGYMKPHKDVTILRDLAKRYAELSPIQYRMKKENFGGITIASFALVFLFLSSTGPALTRFPRS
jgi:hypothetical protein